MKHPYTSSGGDVCCGTARTSLSEAYKLLELYGDELASACKYGSIGDVEIVGGVIRELLAAITKAEAWMRAAQV